MEVIPPLPELEVWVEREEEEEPNTWSRLDSVSVYSGETVTLRFVMFSL